LKPQALQPKPKENSSRVTVDITAYAASHVHFSSIIALARTHYSAGHAILSEEFLQWLLLDNPAGPATLVVGREGDMWIGMVMLIPVRLVRDGIPQQACYAVNVLTHPDHRGKNLFVRMIGTCRDRLAKEHVWLLGHPNANAVPGWKRREMHFRDALHPHLAKLRLPFSSVKSRRVKELTDLHGITPVYWDELRQRADYHVDYTPEYIAWRFMAAPHRQYVVAAIERRGSLLGLRVTRRFKGPLDLMIDFIGTAATLSAIISSVGRPTLLMHCGTGYSGSAVRSACVRLPTNRSFAFFVSTWMPEDFNADMSGISLAASDF
jgi:hypothetical protein